MYKISFLQSHPIQYHSPLYDELEKHKSVDFKVYYCSDYGLSKDGKRVHPEFGQLPNWDVDLVNNHTYEILKNNALKKGIFKGFFGLVNFGIFRELKKNKPDVLVINGWNYFTMVWAVLCCKILGIKSYLRGDNTLSFDHKLSPFKRRIKRMLYGYFLFPFYSKIAYVGENNKRFFLAYKVPDSKLISLPHAIDNDRFLEFYKKNTSLKGKIKEDHGFNKQFNLLFVGRLHESKRVFDAIKAVELLAEGVSLLIVGDGLLREAIEDYIKNNHLNWCKVLGFKNQQEIMEYYLIADAIVLPSNYLETWGLVINEAMNFDLPVLVSDKVGCAPDLCTANNGFIFEVGDTITLSKHVEYLMKNPNIAKKMGVESGKLIQNYSYNTIIHNLIESL